ncbi:hypothetical protein Pst134EA_015152 [Puccinia striiformis f. sp. tritici]|uniref:hypothetical protein n=1 Tax=Puccinia striiformis f. sp. tritici TaxID=168172 RepID=UPI0020073CEA|nr:hypothetical protein Pst134EA_015152 [Puccinia striiformis f. sp. tritici]KAH9463065.1 hypothetical protein Pst134EA_015152 [Puccinia striiformis f. sp. tritici]
MQLVSIAYPSLTCSLFTSQVICARPAGPLFCDADNCSAATQRHTKTLLVADFTSSLACGTFRGTNDCAYEPSTTTRQCTTCRQVVVTATSNCQQHDDLRGRSHMYTPGGS